MTAAAPTLHRDGLAERERVLSILREQEPALRAQGITRLRLFGSMARGEAGPDSDVDLIAYVDPKADFSLLDHAGVELDLGDLIGRTVEVATAPWKMRPRVKCRVEADAIEVF